MHAVHAAEEAVDDDDVLDVDVWSYVQYDYRKVPQDFSLVTTDACNAVVGKQRWARLYGHAHARKSPAALLLAETLDASMHERAVERAFSRPWIATRVSAFIDRRRTYACLTSLSSFMRTRLLGDALTSLPWLQALKACRPCTTVLPGDDVAAAGLHVVHGESGRATQRYIGVHVRVGVTSKALMILRVKRGRITHVESAACLTASSVSEKDGDAVTTCTAAVGKRATLDLVSSKSGKTHLYVRLSSSKTLMSVISVGLELRPDARRA